MRRESSRLRGQAVEMPRIGRWSGLFEDLQEGQCPWGLRGKKAEKVGKGHVLKGFDPGGDPASVPTFSFLALIPHRWGSIVTALRLRVRNGISMWTIPIMPQVLIKEHLKPRGTTEVQSQAFITDGRVSQKVTVGPS